MNDCDCGCQRHCRELLGVGDLSELVDLKQSTLYVMSSRGELPPPDGAINKGRNRFWMRSTIETWNDTRRNRE